MHKIFLIIFIFIAVSAGLWGLSEIPHASVPVVIERPATVVETIPEVTADIPEATATIPEPPKPKLPITVAPTVGMQGDPVRIVFENAVEPEEIAAVTVDGTPVFPFRYGGFVQAVYGIDINHAVGGFPIAATFADGRIATATLTVTERAKPVAAFTIPESLGGTNPQGEANVSALLTKENAILAGLTTNPRRLWSAAFTYPTEPATVTDPYGYNRDTGTRLVTHKGLDFRAPVGTPVYAINRGVVRLVKAMKIYGNTVVIDHGQGIMSFYMHLSKAWVTQGTIVEAGTKIGESGATGYAEGPHLHLTIRVNGVSIDPLRFLELY